MGKKADGVYGYIIIVEANAIKQDSGEFTVDPKIISSSSTGARSFAFYRQKRQSVSSDIDVDGNYPYARAYFSIAITQLPSRV